jgi:hypothetical protein
VTPLTFVCWKWSKPGYRSTFGPNAVNTLRKMVARHYDAPHRFCCVTDDAEGLDPEVEVIPDWKDFADLPAPSGPRNPSCYRRLRAFDPNIGDVFGPRFVSMDLDLVITGDLKPVVNRPEDFVIFADTTPKTFYNGSLMLMTAGARPQVWERFDPATSIPLARSAGHMGSDQAWISYCLGPKEAKWTTADGVYSFRNHLGGEGQNPARQLPPNAKVIVWHGAHDPWGRVADRLPWMKEHYR